MKHYHKNPRTITKRQMSDLKKWLVEFGDLSGIVHNIPTDEIIGGNQRSEALPGVISGLIQPVITERFDPPLADGTVCNGYYEIDGRRYQYRGVNWDDKKAERANLIANKAGGTFDMDILANQFDLPVLLDSGFTEFDLGVKPDFDPMAEWEGMPEFEQEDKTAVKSIGVSFSSIADYESFAELVGQKLTEKTRSIWYPEQKPDIQKDYRVQDES